MLVNNVLIFNLQDTGKLMNTLIKYGIEVVILSAIVLIVGMIKPKWVLLWIEKPGRIAIACISAAIFMAGMVMFGEGNKQLQQEKAQLSQQQTAQPAKLADEVPKPAAESSPTPAPNKP
jgi:hypothetical protein